VISILCFFLLFYHPKNNDTESSAKHGGPHILNTFVISLKSSTARRTSIAAALNKTKLFEHGQWSFMTAIQGNSLLYADLAKDGKITRDGLLSVWHKRTVHGEYLTPGAVGCILSHREVWKKVGQMKGPVLVLEDDVTFVENFYSKLRNALVELPSDFGILYLADLVGSAQTKLTYVNYRGKYTDKITGEYWGTYGYVITPSAAQVLYDEIFPLDRQADSYIMKVTKLYGVTVYRTKEDLVRTDNTDGRKSLTQTTDVSPTGVGVSKIFVLGNGEAKTIAIKSTRKLKIIPVVFSSGILREFKLHTKCMSIVKLHGGICISDKFLLFSTLENVLSTIAIMVARDQQGNVLPGFLYGKKNDALVKKFADLYHNRFSGGQYSTAEFTNFWYNLALQYPKDVRILPYWFFYPLPVITFKRKMVQPPAVERRLVSELASVQSLYGTFAAGIYLPLPNIPHISKIIHFIWLQEEISSLRMMYLKTCMALHPLWKFKLWKVSDLRSLTAVQQKISESNDQRQISDLARYEILYKMGGLYLDSDFFFFKSLDSIPLDFPILCHEDGASRIHISISNGMMGFPPGHPALGSALKLLEQARMNGRYIVRQTGPGFFSRVMKTYLDNARLLPYDTFYPVSFKDKDTLTNLNCYSRSCKDSFPRSTALHLWGASKYESSYISIEILDAMVKEHNSWRLQLLQIE
jgi:GR25 family glycosyltransferase involved in LPS biosynthesis/mannosyltransferase OCH1-like enzyme